MKALRHRQAHHNVDVHLSDKCISDDSLFGDLFSELPGRAYLVHGPFRNGRPF